jgi:hypothetical protein
VEIYNCNIYTINKQLHYLCTVYLKINLDTKRGALLVFMINTLPCCFRPCNKKPSQCHGVPSPAECAQMCDLPTVPHVQHNSLLSLDVLTKLVVLSVHMVVQTDPLHQLL